METIEVAAGVVFNPEGKLLICQRMGKLEGLWEFPGGKLEAGESAPQALRRELTEELELPVETGEELCVIEQHQGDKELRLHFIRAYAAGGETLVLHVHRSALWIQPEQTGQYPFCAADAEFLEKKLLLLKPKEDTDEQLSNL